MFSLSLNNSKASSWCQLPLHFGSTSCHLANCPPNNFPTSPYSSQTSLLAVPGSLLLKVCSLLILFLPEWTSIQLYNSYSPFKAQHRVGPCSPPRWGMQSSEFLTTPSHLSPSPDTVLCLTACGFSLLVCVLPESWDWASHIRWPWVRAEKLK